MASQYDTELVIDGVIVPLRSAIDYTETWTAVGTATARQTWDGETHILAPTYDTKYRISIQASGQGVWRLPEIDKLRPGDLITIHSRFPRTERIPQGLSSCVLPRPIVPGSLRAAHPKDPSQRFLCSALGRLVGIHDADLIAVPAPFPVLVTYRPKLLCKVLIAGDGSVNGRTGEVQWTLEAVEKSPPSYEADV